MRGQIILNFLETLGQFGNSAADHLEGFLRAGYGASFSRMEYYSRRVNKSALPQKHSVEEEKRLRRQFIQMRYYLENDGLIARTKGKDFILTQLGRFKLRLLKKQFSERLLIPRYFLEKGAEILIVSFDIPEKDRRKRSWLRSVLKNMGLKMVQQSFWVGRGKLPSEFLEDISKMRLGNCIEIFQVTKLGSLNRVVA